jgi:hypothetical protein
MITTKKIHTIIVICLTVLGFTACRDNKIVGLEKVLTEWIGKTILFPDIKPVYIFGDSLNHTFKTDTIAKNYKILLYTDSTGCTSHQLNLNTWKSFIEELNSNVDFLFYFQPANEKELLSLLANERFIYPIYIDNRDELNKLNRFFNNPVFKCFLLDKNNKILAVGNPGNNVMLWKLYKKIITDKISNDDEKSDTHF